MIDVALMVGCLALARQNHHEVEFHEGRTFHVILAAAWYVMSFVSMVKVIAGLL